MASDFGRGTAGEDGQTRVPVGEKNEFGLRGAQTAGFGVHIGGALSGGTGDFPGRADSNAGVGGEGLRLQPLASVALGRRVEFRIEVLRARRSLTVL